LTTLLTTQGKRNPKYSNKNQKTQRLGKEERTRKENLAALHNSA